MPPRDATHALVVGFTGPRDAGPSFRRCRTVAVVHNGAGLDNQEQGMPVMLCTVTAPWPVIWDRLTHFD
jgi:hypothetical protein